MEWKVSKGNERGGRRGLTGKELNGMESKVEKALQSSQWKVQKGKAAEVSSERQTQRKRIQYSNRRPDESRAGSRGQNERY